MRLKRMICISLACMLIIGTIVVPANAIEAENNAPESRIENLVIYRATGSFSMTIPAKSKALADSSFPMAVGETVTIKASYVPFDANVDFGLVDSDGVFHYFNITNGSIDKTILIEESGRYTLQVRNNSGSEVKVSGFVNY